MKALSNTINKCLSWKTVKPQPDYVNSSLEKTHDVSLSSAHVSQILTQIYSHLDMPVIPVASMVWQDLLIVTCLGGELFSFFFLFACVRKKETQ